MNKKEVMFRTLGLILISPFVVLVLKERTLEALIFASSVTALLFIGVYLLTAVDSE